MDVDEIRLKLAARPSVHLLCKGAFLQEPIAIGSRAVLVPLKPLGYLAQADYVGRYVHELTDALVDADAVNSLAQQGANAWPVVAIVAQCSKDAAPEALELEAEPQLQRGRQLLAWASGDDVTPFGVVTVPCKGSYFRMMPPHSRRRQRLGFGNTGNDYSRQIERIVESAEADDHFAFAISIYHDAMREDDPRFRIARLFNCLECLAGRLKNSDRPSRKAVKHLLGLSAGGMDEVSGDLGKIRYDPIEIAGRVRDKLFHGTPFRSSDLNAESQPAFALYEQRPQHIAETLQMHCELEIARWANGVSRGRTGDGAQGDAPEHERSEGAS